MADKYYAHSTKSDDKTTWQSLEEHLNKVAELASGFARPFHAQQWARVMGLFHDLGKGSKEFQRRLLGGPRVDHSTAGAQTAERLHKDKKIGWMLAYAIAGHHGGMPDAIGAGTSPLRMRLKKQIPAFAEFAKSFPLPEQITALPFELDDKREGFQQSFLVRMLFSCLTDADWLDTEGFLDPEKADWRKGYPSLAELKPALDLKLDEFRAVAGEKHLNQRRTEIMERCRQAASWEPGLFSLTVPTGGGKTISSLAMAMEHALEYGMERIIYVIPYTSIIEQNAQVFRDILGNEAVVEHHSSLPLESESEEDSVNNDIRRARLAAENWDAPIIVTTNVQFFESLFSNRPARCRKLHNIANSVVILDEAQMLPRRLLKPCMEALRELTTNYCTSVVLCTATQPTLNDADTFKGMALEPREVMGAREEREQLFKDFERVEAEDLGKLCNDDLVERLAGHDRVLCIVNARKDARVIYQRLVEQVGEQGCYHLSALMYPAHRKEKLAEIGEALELDRPCRVIATQLIECGVDISFPVVYRAIAGIDSLAQAAGRCNREGEPGGKKGTLYIFEPESGLPKISDLRDPAQKAREVLSIVDDPLGLDAVETFFDLLFWQENLNDGLDKKKIIHSLSKGVKKSWYPFRSAARDFRYIESEGEAVLVCRDTELREKIIDGLTNSENPGFYARMAQPYTVQVYKFEMDNLGAAVERRGPFSFPVLMNMDAYDTELGLVVEQADRMSTDSTVI